MSDNEKIEIKPREQTGGALTPEAPSPDDSGSQALSEALQSSFVIVKFLMVVLVGAFLCSGFFTVGPQQQAIKLRFGKPVGEGTNALLGPGFHWAFPKPIDEVTNISIGQIQVAASSIGWFAVGADGESSYVGPSLNPAVDGYTLTADTNIIHSRAFLRYRITDPIRYLFDYVNAGEFVTNALNNAVLYASSRFTVDEALTDKLPAFRECVTSRAEELIRRQNLGIKIEQIDVKTIAPRQLTNIFLAVVQAGINQQNTNTQALSYTNTVLSKARSEAQSRINAAMFECAQLTSQVQVDATNFTSQLPQFLANPDLFVQKRQTETLGRVLAKVQEKMFLPSQVDGKPRELRLQLNREPMAPPPAQPAQ